MGVFAARPAFADSSVSKLGMGQGAGTEMAFHGFMGVIHKFNASGERFEIDGYCRSACTMFLSIRNSCIASGAILAFHSGGDYKNRIHSAAATNQMLATYKPALRAYLVQNHIMDSFDFTDIPGSDMVSKFGYKAC